jgi:hypothetical protein
MSALLNDISGVSRIRVVMNCRPLANTTRGADELCAWQPMHPVPGLTLF